MWKFKLFNNNNNSYYIGYINLYIYNSTISQYKTPDNLQYLATETSYCQTTHINIVFSLYKEWGTRSGDWQELGQFIGGLKRMALTSAGWCPRCLHAFAQLAFNSTNCWLSCGRMNFLWAETQTIWSRSRLARSSTWQTPTLTEWNTDIPRLLNICN